MGHFNLFYPLPRNRYIDIFTAFNFCGSLNQMNDGSGRIRKGRMIHIRLDDKTHRQLKIHAAQNDTTIQQLVENLICQKFIELQAEDVQV
jgi:hypothetical protein